MQPWNSAVLLLPLCLFVADQIFRSDVRAIWLATKNTESTKSHESILKIGVPGAMQPWISAVLLWPLCLFVADQIFRSDVRAIWLATKNTESTKSRESILKIDVPGVMQPWISTVLLWPLCVFVADQIFQSVVRAIG
jgi:predicted DCC family thiol-disulfide oxidoreductase YuxK